MADTQSTKQDHIKWRLHLEIFDKTVDPSVHHLLKRGAKRYKKTFLGVDLIARLWLRNPGWYLLIEK